MLTMWNKNTEDLQPRKRKQTSYFCNKVTDRRILETNKKRSKNYIDEAYDESWNMFTCQLHFCI